MNKEPSLKEGVGNALISRAALALFLAKAVEVFVGIRGSQETQQESGGWTPLTFTPEIDHPTFFQQDGD